MVLRKIMQELQATLKPDLGIEDNVIAEDVVSRLEQGAGRPVEHRKFFGVADRTLVETLGRLSVSCASRDRLSRRYTAYALSFGYVLVHS